MQQRGREAACLERGGRWSHREGGRLKARLSSTEDEGNLLLISPGEEGKRRGGDLRIQWDRRLTSGGNTEWPGSPQEGRHNVGELNKKEMTLCPAWLSRGPCGGEAENESLQVGGQPRLAARGGPHCSGSESSLTPGGSPGTLRLRVGTLSPRKPSPPFLGAV